MARYKDFKNDKFYKRPGTPVNQAPKPEIHFYPDITDEALKSDKYDIDFTLSYADVKKKMEALEDIWTPQMAFANRYTAEHYTVYIHYLDMENDTQRVAIVDFSLSNEVIVREWV